MRKENVHTIPKDNKHNKRYIILNYNSSENKLSPKIHVNHLNPLRQKIFSMWHTHRLTKT